ncbi:P-loop containing nucleoside triphosphate hydrolase protein [Triangularia verruculosa]|uniref:P-loop containing nucleoside triphosphate hydrolase protein n=1 Tax=Triangularia verruculosa TaxID=2587418 RepID=A0AAN7AX72_9PEZI|nr:P-loop containing nucleoside triphosphate hydrolase protein [Triangularia verruculosa]
MRRPVYRATDDRYSSTGSSEFSDAPGPRRPYRYPRPRRAASRSPQDSQVPPGKPQRVVVKRNVVTTYRDRRGDLQSRTHEDDPKEPQRFSDPRTEAPSISVCRELNERGDLWRRTIQVDSWSYYGYLQAAEKFALHATWQSSGIIFAEPFVELFFRQKALRNLHNAANSDPDALAKTPEERYDVEITGHILHFLENDAADIGNRLEAMAAATAKTSVQFIDLWMLYPPGTLVFELPLGDEPRCFMVDSVTFEKPEVTDSLKLSALSPLVLHCWAIDYDGVAFGRREHTLTIKYFPDSIEISTLLYQPERFLEDSHKKTLKAQLKSRGQAFWDMQGHSFREVHGLSKDGSLTRVMVDRKTYGSLFSTWVNPTTTAAGLSHWDPREGVDIRDELASNMATIGGVTNSNRGGFSDLGFPSKAFVGLGTWYNEYDVIDPSQSPDELTLLLCPKTVHAFSLREKAWFEYDVSNLKPVEFRENAWSRLVLNSEYKDIIRAMVRSYLGNKTQFQDLVAGKGVGLVVLMHGPPGVGKTLTAECVAEAFQKPLYMVTAGDLGTDAETLEKKLQTIFNYAVSWNAILLLDEADIFLQDRDYDNLQRNALVSIFLRTLEYFNGIMFLTSNRVGAFDQAFQSRIHITIGMPEFDEQLRKEVWSIFIKDLGRKRSDGSPPILTKDECRELGREVIASWAREPLNGRQIRNCVRSALALAEDKGVKPNVGHFNTVIRLGNAFTTYMKRLQKVESDEIAQIKGDRLAVMRDMMRESTAGSSSSARAETDDVL